MRPYLRLSFVIALAACGDRSVGARNAPPTANITSHDSPVELREGYPVVFRGYVGDPDHRVDQLQVAWYLNEQAICDLAAPANEGRTECAITPVLGSMTIQLEAVDPRGAAGVDTLEITVVPTEPPVAEIVEPVATADLLSEWEGRIFAGNPFPLRGLVSDEEDFAAQLSVAWTATSGAGGSVTFDVPPTPSNAGETVGSGTLTEGAWTVRLEVTDVTGKTGFDEVAIEVGPPNALPLCDLLSPAAGDVFASADAAVLTALVTDPDHLNDEIDVAVFSSLDGEVYTSNPTSAGNVSGVLFLEDGEHVLTLRGRDPLGGTCADAVDVVVRKPPVVTGVTLSPDPATVQDETLTCSATATYGTFGDVVPQLEYVWTRVGEAEPLHEETLASGVASTLSGAHAYGDTIRCTVTGFDGALYGASAHDELVIENVPPNITGASLNTYTPGAIDDLTVTTAGYVDADGHPEASPRVVWQIRVEGAGDWVEVSGESGTTLSAEHFAMRDRVRAIVYPRDTIGGEGVSVMTPEAEVMGWVRLPSSSSDSWFMAAIRSDGTVWTWGMNSLGSLGTGPLDLGASRATPVQVSGLDDEPFLKGVSQIAIGESFAIALLDDRRVVGWGRGNIGQLGTGDLLNRGRPVRIGSPLGEEVPLDELVEVSSVGVGRYQTYIVDSEGGLWGMGRNNGGELGLGPDEHLYFWDESEDFDISPFWNDNPPGENYRVVRPTPITTFPSDVRVKASAGYTRFGWALDDAGRPWVWGSNLAGALGAVERPNELGFRTTPGRVWTSDFEPSFGNVRSMDCGGASCVVIDQDGLVWGWGNNSRRQLGDVLLEGSWYSTTAVRLTGRSGDSDGFTEARQVRTSRLRATFILDEDGLVWSMGTTELGILGRESAGEYMDTLEPVVGPDGGVLTRIASIAATQSNVFALDEDGVLWAWGDKRCGRLGAGILPTVFPDPGTVCPPEVESDLQRRQSTPVRVHWE
jgi:alpha-tubulin suppressor-like RCC1 family protein